MEKNIILKGNICYSKDSSRIVIRENSFLICKDGKSEGVFEQIPEEYRNFELQDYGNALIIPGCVDLHLHASQFAFRGFGMDLELLDWLNTITFPEEAQYQEAEYAQRAYHIFADTIKKSETTRAVIFGTIHTDATIQLMDEMEKTGIKTYVGRVNMDRNAPDILCEKSADISLEETEKWIDQTSQRYENVKPILTPRFVPSCSNELLCGIGKLQKKYGLSVQSHLSENPSEVSWVQELHPDTSCYGEAYDKYGLFGENGKTIMAHSVYSDEKEIELLKKRGVWVAHCPQSNINLSSGIAPIRTYLDRGIRVGLGTDLAAGFSISILRAMGEAIQMSKMRWRLIDTNQKPLRLEEAFFLGTKGGGSFFGKVGSFEKGYEMDAVVLDDTTLPYPHPLSVRQRLERMIYLSDDRHIKAKFVCGKQIF
ncbi:MAG: amidohydrolase family protein [Eubacteriales bacterium]|nr:amidohydrolase family protein [Eubacteriales bacterium]